MSDHTTQAQAEIAKLLKESAALMKRDAREAIVKLEMAYRLAVDSSMPEQASEVAQELARAWGRRRSSAKSVHYARKSVGHCPEAKSAWNTLAKTCELVGSLTQGPEHRRRAQALFRSASAAFRKAASLTKDPEDKRWLLELASDAASSAK